MANFQLIAISRPSLLQSATQENNRLAGYASRVSKRDNNTEQRKLPTHPGRRIRCNCSARCADSQSEAFRTSLYVRAFGLQGLFRYSVTSTGWHHQDCPMYPSSSTVDTARFSIGICGALLNRAAEASISIIRGAGGFSISPKLHCSRLVSNKCKAFRLVRFYEYERLHMNTLGDWEKFLNRITREIERLFRVGEATPYDVDLEGNTLLHVRGQQTFLHRAKLHR